MEINNSRYDSRTYTCVLCVCFEAALEQRTGDVFVLFVERVHCLHNALKCNFYFSAYKTELELKLRENLAQILCNVSKI